MYFEKGWENKKLKIREREAYFLILFQSILMKFNKHNMSSYQWSQQRTIYSYNLFFNFVQSGLLKCLFSKFCQWKFLIFGHLEDIQSCSSIRRISSHSFALELEDQWQSMTSRPGVKIVQINIFKNPPPTIIVENADFGTKILTNPWINFKNYFISR